MVIAVKLNQPDTTVSESRYSLFSALVIAALYTASLMELTVCR